MEDKTPTGYPTDKLKPFEEMLLHRRQQILRGIDDQRAEMENFKGEAESDVSDDASNQVELNIQMTLSDTQKRELDEISTALMKIEDRTYGTCEGCEQLIAEARLRALPFATLCVQCKGQQERGSVIVRRETRTVPIDHDLLAHANGDEDDF